VLSDSHAVAWTFNIRGADVSHTPLPLSYALVPKDGRPTVFIDHRKLSNSAATISNRPPMSRSPTRWRRSSPRWRKAALDRARQRHRRRRAEPADRPPAASRCAATIRSACSRRSRTHRDRGTRTAHRRDAVALARFLAWIDREAPSGG
jgi:Xaa-Pro aminopeptidase